jgi:hypothetical protein
MIVGVVAISASCRSTQPDACRRRGLISQIPIDSARSLNPSSSRSLLMPRRLLDRPPGSLIKSNQAVAAMIARAIKEYWNDELFIPPHGSRAFS